AYAARVTAEWAAVLPDALELLTAAVGDEHPRVRLEAVVASSHVPQPGAVEVAVKSLDQPSDRFIDYALRQTVRALQPQWQKPLAENKLTFGGKAEHLAYVKKIAATAPAVAHPGQAVYDALCLNCHQPGGKGLPGVYPPLEGSEWVSGDTATLIKIVLHGLTGPIQVAGTEYGKAVPVPMPPMGLDDQQVADVLTYIRSSFGHKSSPVKPEEVKATRAATAQRTTFWTPEELKK
ncbi:MAG TPA: c-type cytochrome, partial [Prosthecobacter sp.]